MNVTGRLAALAGDVRGLRVLDAGCGGGALAARLAARGARVAGLDLRGGPVRGDVLFLPFAGGAFDLAVCSLVLHYVPSPERAVGELARVLRPGGRLLLCDRVGSAEPALRAGQEVLERMRRPAFARLLAPPELAALLGGAGFEVAFEEPLEEAVDLDAWTEGSALLARELEALRGWDLGGLQVSTAGHAVLRGRLLEATLRRPR